MDGIQSTDIKSVKIGVLLRDESVFVLHDSSCDVSSCRWTITSTDSSGQATIICARKSRPPCPAYTTTIQLVNSFIISWVDYCNSILAGVLKYQLDRLQFILNMQRDRYLVTAVMNISHHFKRPPILAAISAAHRFRLMFDCIQSAAWSRPRLHLWLLCQNLVKPQRSSLHSWNIVWLDQILQLCCKWALVLLTVRAYGPRRNINYHKIIIVIIIIIIIIRRHGEYRQSRVRIRRSTAILTDDVDDDFHGAYTYI